jgi:hypothetical protein
VELVVSDAVERKYEHPDAAPGGPHRLAEHPVSAVGGEVGDLLEGQRPKAVGGAGDERRPEDGEK